jgi:hypothetical protein
MSAGVQAMALPTPYSYRTYASTGAAQTLAVPFPFVAREHVHVYVGWLLSDGSRESELMPGTGFSWINNGSLLIQPVASGKSVSVVRLTPIDQQVVQWQQGSPPTASELSAADRQILYVVQEWLDRVTNLQGEVNIIVDDGLQIAVVDSLTSSSITTALSANQGRILKGLYDDLSELVDEIIENGTGPPVTIVDALNSDSSSSALSAKQGKLLKQLIDALAERTETTEEAIVFLDGRLDAAEQSLVARNTLTTSTAQVTAAANEIVAGTITLSPCTVVHAIGLSRKGTIALYNGTAGMTADLNRPFLTEAPDGDNVVTMVRLENPGTLALGYKPVVSSPTGGNSFPFRFLNEGSGGETIISISHLPLKTS